MTRDIWRIVNQEFNGKYFARTSFISLMSPPVVIVESDIGLDSEYDRSNIMADANRTPLQWIAENRPAQLILDFVSEHNNIVEVDGSYLLQTEELKQSGLLEKSLPSARVIARESSECESLWQVSMQKFAEFLQQNSPHTKVIIHKARRVMEYTDGSIRLPFADIDWILNYNVMMERYWRLAVAVFNDPVVLEAPSAFQVASQMHTWGLSPVHYIDDYYYEIWKQLQIAP